MTRVRKKNPFPLILCQCIELVVISNKGKTLEELVCTLKIIKSMVTHPLPWQNCELDKATHIHIVSLQVLKKKSCSAAKFSLGEADLIVFFFPGKVNQKHLWSKPRALIVILQLTKEHCYPFCDIKLFIKYIK